MIQFILNDRLIEATESSGLTVVDYVRSCQHLTGTKTGCREGDCGACTVLVGEWRHGQLQYQTMTSCLMALGNAQGKHIVTIEGINPPKGLNPVQRAMVEEAGTQCGFCTVGFIVSLMGFCLSDKTPTYQNGIAAIDGNICRCTGYKSIERAVSRIIDVLATRPANSLRLDYLVQTGFLPAYFALIPQRLVALQAQNQNGQVDYLPKELTVVGGGTDLLVQKPELMRHAAIRHISVESAMKSIRQEGDTCYVGAACTAEDLQRSAIFNRTFPDLSAHMKLVSSTPIRNMGTVGGNLINASPIGDLTIWFLTLNAQVVLRQGNNRRTLPLRELYQGYKKLAKVPDEILEALFFQLPTQSHFFSFEKVCKRTYLDIASVNTAILLRINDNLIDSAHVSAGGVAPVPLYLGQTSAFLAGKKICPQTLEDANAIAQAEISPINDVRGSADYKRLLFRQLFFAHFLKGFPAQAELLSDVF